MEKLIFLLKLPFLILGEMDPLTLLGLGFIWLLFLPALFHPEAREVVCGWSPDTYLGAVFWAITLPGRTISCAVTAELPW